MADGIKIIILPCKFADNVERKNSEIGNKTAKYKYKKTTVYL